MLQRRAQTVFAAENSRRKLARRNIRPGDRAMYPVLVTACDKIVFLFVQQSVFDERARRYDADHVALDHALCRRGIGKLFADRDFFPESDELRDVSIRRVKRNAAHRRSLFQPAIPARQRKIEKPRHLFRILEKHLVKIPEPVKDDAVFIFVFDFKIMPHHRRQSAHKRSPLR